MAASLLASAATAFPRLVDRTPPPPPHPPPHSYISADVNVNWSERDLPCAHDRNLELHNHSAAHRRSWRDPPIPSLACFPGRCFRGVYDGRVSLATHRHQWRRGLPNETLVDAQLDAVVAGRKPPVVVGPPKSERLHDEEAQRDYSNQIMQLLHDEFGVDLATIRESTKRFKEYASTDRDFGGNPRIDSTHTRTLSCGGRYAQMHSDYYESANYVFTAVLYLGDEVGDDVARVGGETALIDEMRRDAAGACELARGVTVEPKPGRLVVFSGGGENYHAPLRVERGRRTTFHVWFDCLAGHGQHGTPVTGLSGGAPQVTPTQPGATAGAATGAAAVIDKHEGCAAWAHGGECEKNEPFMRYECARSCAGKLPLQKAST